MIAFLAGLPDWVKPLLGVVVGWILGVFTQHLRDYRRERRYRHAIYVELKDVHSALRTRIPVIVNILELYIRDQKILDSYPEIAFPIYEKCFAEVALQFSESERLALSHIYEHVRTLNWHAIELKKRWEQTLPDANAADQKKYISLVEGAFSGARNLDAMISLVLSQKSNFDIRSAENERILNEHDAKFKEDLQRIIERGRSQKKLA